MVDSNAYPLVKEWEIFFKRKDGKTNRAKVAMAFHEFWKDREKDMLWVDGKVKLGGVVYMSPNFPNNSEITTSYVISFDRLSREDINGYQHDLICALTQSGNKYFFFSDEFCAHMFMMLGDITHLGRLSEEKDHYLRENRRGKDFL